MFGDRVVHTAADLVWAARCEFALLRALDAELGTLPAESPEPPVREDDSVSAHRYGPDAVVVTPAPRTGAARTRGDALAAAHTATLAALRGGAPAVLGPTFFDGAFARTCAALVRADDGEYVAHGTADSEFDAVGVALALAACAAAAADHGIGTASWMSLRVDGVDTVLRSADLLPVLRARMRRMARIIEDKLGELIPVQWGDPRFLACGRCPTCVAALRAARDPLLVAGMTEPTRTRLREAGIATVERLAGFEGTVPGVPARTMAALRAQAGVQVVAERAAAPSWRLVEPRALACLPAPTPGDLSLVCDDPAAGPWRLEVGGAGVVHRDHRVHGRNPAAERARHTAVRDLVTLLARARREQPDLRVYHYGAAGRTALIRACAEAGVGEEIGEILSGEAGLVDLYPITRAAVIVGGNSYAPAALREFLAAEDPAARTEHDCVTLLRLRDRLLAERARTGVATTGGGPTEPPVVDGPSSVEAALTEFASRGAGGDHPAALVAAASGYHRREFRRLWWAHADRLTYPLDEWSDAAGVLVADTATVDTTWHHSPARPELHRYLTLSGRIGTGDRALAGTGTPLPPGTTVVTYYDRPGAGSGASPGRRGVGTAVVLGCSVDSGFDDTVRLEESLPEGHLPHDELPIAIAPEPPLPPPSTAAALESIAQRLLVALPEVPRTALFDILARRDPRLRGDADLPAADGDHAAAITAAVAALDDSYVAVQGPPGTGKTSTAARVIQRLVATRRWRVGVVAVSRATVENILDAVVELGILPELVAKKDVGAVAPEWAVIDADRYPRFLDNAVNGCVLGGAPADFADAGLVPPGALDLLVVADAGHLPLAELIALGASARNLLVIGDPATTAARAAHPAPVGDSVLGWLTEGATLPVRRGYFLDRTWRMPPPICEPLSTLRYDGRLISSETVTLARRLEGVAPGVESVGIDHHGNTTESEAEAREVVRRVRALLGATWTVGAHTRRLHPHDIFVVAPYGAQVRRIRTLLARARIEDVLVGTPERFRGREAAVVLISLATSTAADAPEGMAALLSRDLIHTAVSRAMWKAVIIRSTLLTEYLPQRSRDLPVLAEFLSLTEARASVQPKQAPSPR